MKNSPRTLCRGAALCALLAPGAMTQIAWQLDYEQARATAQRERKPLFVAVVQAGEAASCGMVGVFAERRIQSALRQGAVPLLVVLDAEPDAALARKLGVTADAGELHERGDAALRALFGPAAEICTPQQLVLGPDGGVVWHGLRACAAKTLVEALATAKAVARKGVAGRREHERRLARGWLHGKANEPDHCECLRAVLRHADDESLGLLLDDARRAKVDADGLLDAVLAGLPEDRAARRVEAMQRAAGCRDLMERARAIAERSRSPGAAPSDQVAVRDIPEPLPVLRAPDALSAVRFADATSRDLVDLRGRVVVLWFFLPDDPRLTEQVAAVAPVLQELERKGARTFALAGGLDVDATLELARGVGVDCPIGAYAFDEHQPWQGVGFFPAAVVIDAQGRYVYCDSTDEVKEYAGFAPTVRGLLQLQQKRAASDDAGGAASASGTGK